jgi:hypothetical protein
MVEPKEAPPALRGSVVPVKEGIHRQGRGTCVRMVKGVVTMIAKFGQGHQI